MRSASSRSARARRAISRGAPSAPPCRRRRPRGGRAHARRHRGADARGRARRREPRGGAAAAGAPAAGRGRGADRHQPRPQRVRATRRREARSPSRPKPTASVVRVDVCDSGPGVADERSERIFEGESTRDGGAGVGLRHARAMARAAGGDLGLVGSAARGDRGARFRLTWPRALPVPAPPRSVPRAKLLEGLRVLVLEDDRDVTDAPRGRPERPRRRGDGRAHRGRARRAPRVHARRGAGRSLAHRQAIRPGAVERMRDRAKDAAIVLITGSAERIPPGLEGDDLGPKALRGGRGRRRPGAGQEELRRQKNEGKPLTGRPFGFSCASSSGLTLRGPREGGGIGRRTSLRC